MNNIEAADYHLDDQVSISSRRNMFNAFVGRSISTKRFFEFYQYWHHTIIPSFEHRKTYSSLLGSMLR